MSATITVKIGWRDALIAVLAAVLVWFGATIVRLENVNYAAKVGMCDEFSDALQAVQRLRCYETVETRTHWIWHLKYALGFAP